MTVRQALKVPGRYGFHSTRSGHAARGVKLVMSDAHEGMKATLANLLKSSWQRCCFDFMRNALAHAARGLPNRLPRDDAEAAKTQWRKVADQFRHKLPKLAPFRGGGDGRAGLHDLPPQHRTKLHSTDEMDKRFFS
jgi:putative transposase